MPWASIKLEREVNPLQVSIVPVRGHSVPNNEDTYRSLTPNENKIPAEVEKAKDDQKRTEADIQKVTDKFIAEIDKVVAAKEQDLLAV